MKHEGVQMDRNKKSIPQMGRERQMKAHEQEGSGTFTYNISRLMDEKKE